MGLLASAISRKSISNSHDLWLEIYGGRKSSSGQVVTTDTAVTVSAVFACCRVIANGMSQIPLKLMQESADGKIRIAAKENALYKLIAAKPNRWQTSFDWRQMASWHIELTGNHFSYINRIGNKVVELFPLMPSQVEVLDAGRGVYVYKVTLANQESRTYPASDILHLKGPTWDSVRGLNILHIARDAIGLSMASEESAATLHKNGINASGVWSVEAILSKDQHSQYTKWIQENYAGPENTGKAVLMDRAAKWQSTQMTGVDAQALETRKYQIEEVCRFFGVMPILAGYSDKTATYASAEQMFLAHLVHTMAPRWEAFEQSLNSQLLTEKERDQGFYFDFVEEGMLRASAEATQKVLLGYVNGGMMTTNEGRAKLDLNPDADPASDKLRIPANITGAVPAPETTPQE
jgi:HK97 family phage portal protein